MPSSKLVLAGLVLTLLGAGACTSETPNNAAAAADRASATPLPSDQASLLGSFEAPLRVESSPYGATRGRMRVDLVNQDGKLAVFLHGAAFYDSTLVRARVDSIDAGDVKGEVVLQRQPYTFTLARTPDGTPGSIALTGPGVPPTTFQGPLEADTTEPTLAGRENASAPWEPGIVRFSEGVLPEDVRVTPNGTLDVRALAPAAGTPWAFGLSYRLALSSAWDTPSQASFEVSVKDPTGNSLVNGTVQVGSAPLPKARSRFDFAVDTPTYPAVAPRLLGDCEGAAQCLRVSQGSKFGLRVAPGASKLRIRYALRAGSFEGTAPKTTVNLTAFVAPGDATEPVETKPLEVTWSTLPQATETRAFATGWADMIVTLPRPAAETGVTVRFDGEPREPVAADPNNPFAPVKARHMVMLVKEAVAE
ncbi:MAG: hypothetical protein IPK71_00250 [Myxococcales bacterium]|nr:hypothetical protein [Myxococcales bacterium]